VTIYSLNILSYPLTNLLSLPFGNLLIFSTIAFTILFNLPVMRSAYRKLMMEVIKDKTTPLEILYLASWFKENPKKIIYVAIGYLLSIIFDLIFLISKFLPFGFLSYIFAFIPTLFVAIIVIVAIIENTFFMKYSSSHSCCWGIHSILT
jgi:hypothetical protein